jgi:hypothetical protein
VSDTAARADANRVCGREKPHERSVWKIRRSLVTLA